jgi:hypothetical protein
MTIHIPGTSYAVYFTGTFDRHFIIIEYYENGEVDYAWPLLAFIKHLLK